MSKPHISPDAAIALANRIEQKIAPQERDDGWPDPDTGEWVSLPGTVRALVRSEDAEQMAAALRSLVEQYERISAAFDLLGKSVVSMEEHERLKEQLQSAEREVTAARIDLAGTREQFQAAVGRSNTAILEREAKLRDLEEQLETAQRHIAGLCREFGITPEDVVGFLGESSPAPRRDG